MKPFLILILSLFTFSSYSQQSVKLFKQGKVQLSELSKLNDNFTFDLPTKESFDFKEVKITSDDFFVTSSSNQKVKFKLGKFYRDEQKNACLSVNGNDIVLLYSNVNGNFELTNQGKQTYAIRPQIKQPFSCFTDDDAPRSEIKTISENLPICRTVKIYFEADYKLFQDKGSTINNTVNYVTALFNQVALLYANEQINVQISQIKVWNTPDPYTSQTNIGNVLYLFRSTIGQNFNGDFAHLLSTRSLGGGIAFVDVLCFKSYAFGVSAIQTSFANVPNYSWSVMVVAHELGHNFGSWHTQSCQWPQGALDNCYYPEGNCPPGPTPINGGTIMSYCHLTQYGINFNNGFGTVPGNYIRQKYNSANCLSGNSIAPSGLQTSNITQNTVTLSWNQVQGSSYTIQWKKTTDVVWAEITNLNINYFILSGLNPNTQYQWKIKTECSSFSNPITFITLPNNPPQCSIITNTTFSNITQTSFKANWTIVQIATSYNLQYRKLGNLNWFEFTHIPSNTLTIQNLLSNTTYQVRVRPECNQTWSNIFQITTLDVISNPCDAPTGLNTINITSTSATFVWNQVQGATYYKIALKFPGSNHFTEIGQQFINPLINFYGFDTGSAYEWKVRTNCSDWSQPTMFQTPSNILNKLSESKSSKQILIFPNPAENELNIIGNESCNFKVFDIQGKAQMIGEINDGKINVSNLSSGMFILNIDNEWIKFVKK